MPNVLATINYQTDAGDAASARLEVYAPDADAAIRVAQEKLRNDRRRNVGKFQGGEVEDITITERPQQAPRRAHDRPTTPTPVQGRRTPGETR